MSRTGEGGKEGGREKREILTVEKEENLPWKKNEKQGGGDQVWAI